MLTVIKPDGSIEKRETHGEPGLELIKQLLNDAWFEVIPLPHGTPYQILVDEEGLQKNLAPNEVASSLSGRPVVGIALLLQGDSMLGRHDDKN